MGGNKQESKQERGLSEREQKVSKEEGKQGNNSVGNEVNQRGKQ